MSFNVIGWQHRLVIGLLVRWVEMENKKNAMLCLLNPTNPTWLYPSRPVDVGHQCWTMTLGDLDNGEQNLFLKNV